MTVPHPTASSAPMAQVSSIGGALPGPATTETQDTAGPAVQPSARERPDLAAARAELIAQAQAAGRGEPGALAQLVARTSAVVWRTCAALVDRQSADDLAQETYLRAIRSLPSYRGEADPTRWLVTIARRVCAEEIARRQRDRLISARLAARRVPDVADPIGESELLDALARLSRPRREALVLTAVTGLSYADAAAVCSCPVGTIRSRIARARADLTAALWPNDPPESQ